MIVAYIRATLGSADVMQAIGAGLLTMTRVLVLVAIASLIWVPVGVWIGLRPWAARG
jgi:NitT/TauT family transport system permease protein